jgi:hypothetical protein
MNLWKQSEGFYGVDRSYFDGSREKRYKEIISGSVGVQEEDRVTHFYPEVISKIKAKDYSYETVRIRKLYEQFKVDKDFLKFEESLLKCKFLLTLDDYEMLLRSNVPLERYIYSTLEYEKEGPMLRYVILGSVVKLTQTRNVHDMRQTSQEKDRVGQVGVVSTVVKYPIRESEKDGQMKIFTDLFKLFQLVPRTNLKVLIVGSASEDCGGGMSYEGLVYMIENSVIHCYDPFEVKAKYTTINNNLVERFPEPYQYAEDIVQYDVVQDDAYVVQGCNRETIDPDRHLFLVKTFSCKWLPGDERYFAYTPEGYGKKMKQLKARRPLVPKGWFKDYPWSHRIAQVAQVGKVDHYEYRVMSPKPILGSNFDYRFGNCGFCREMAFYCSHNYTNDFFDYLARAHSMRSSCSIKTRILVPRCDGPIEREGRGFHFLKILDNPVTMRFERVEGYKEVVNFNPTSNFTYVFKAIDRIPYYYFYGQVAVYDPIMEGFLVNYVNPLERTEYSEVVNGVGCERVEAIEEPYHEIEKLFSDPIDGKVPLVDYKLLGEKPQNTLISLFWKYAKFYLRKEGRLFLIR